MPGNQNSTFSLSMESKAQFIRDYRTIVSNISDLSSIPKLRINRDVPDKNFFIIDLCFFDEKITLVYNAKDYYLLGFIGKSNKYYYFSDSLVTSISRTTVQKNLGYPGNYIQLGTPGLFTQATIGSYITTLHNFDGSKPVTLKKTLSTIIFSTSEAFRFKNVAKNVHDILETEHAMNSLHYEDDVKNWASLSSQALQGKVEAIQKVNIAKKF